MKTELKCPRCKHQWEYKGKNPYYVTCPHCYTKVNIRKLKGGKEQ